MKVYPKLQVHQRQRGNALFIVVMVTTLLTAVGLYSMRAASLANQATGYNRQGTQAAYIAEFAVTNMISELHSNPTHYYQRMLAGTDDCRATASLARATNSRPSCYKQLTGDLWLQAHARYGNAVGSDRSDYIGVLSRGDLEGAFAVEMTDLTRVNRPIAGEDSSSDHFRYMQTVLTARGQVRPRVTAGEEAVCDEALTITAGQQTVRAQVSFGPVGR